MLETITLWTLLVWAETRASAQALAATQVPGFATREACHEAREALIVANAAASHGAGSRRLGETGVDIKLSLCIPVRQPLGQNPG